MRKRGIEGGVLKRERARDLEEEGALEKEKRERAIERVGGEF